jgi:hypothetical protein
VSRIIMARAHLDFLYLLLPGSIPKQRNYDKVVCQVNLQDGKNKYNCLGIKHIARAAGCNSDQQHPTNANRLSNPSNPCCKPKRHVVGFNISMPCGYPCRFCVDLVSGLEQPSSAMALGVAVLNCLTCCSDSDMK